MTTSLRQGDHTGSDQRDLMTPGGRSQQLQIPRDRQGKVRVGSRSTSRLAGAKALGSWPCWAAPTSTASANCWRSKRLLWHQEAYRNLFGGLLERGLSGVPGVVSDDQAIKQAVATELPEAVWQRCVVHVEGNVLAHIPARDKKAGGHDVVFTAKAAC